MTPSKEIVFRVKFFISISPKFEIRHQPISIERGPNSSIARLYLTLHFGLGWLRLGVLGSGRDEPHHGSNGSRAAVYQCYTRTVIAAGYSRFSEPHLSLSDLLRRTVIDYVYLIGTGLFLIGEERGDLSLTNGDSDGTEVHFDPRLRFDLGRRGSSGNEPEVSAEWRDVTPNPNVHPGQWKFSKIRKVVIYEAPS